MPTKKPTRNRTSTAAKKPTKSSTKSPKTKVKAEAVNHIDTQALTDLNETIKKLNEQIALKDKELAEKDNTIDQLTQSLQACDIINKANAKKDILFNWLKWVKKYNGYIFDDIAKSALAKIILGEAKITDKEITVFIPFERLNLGLYEYQDQQERNQAYKFVKLTAITDYADPINVLAQSKTKKGVNYTIANPFY